MRLTAWIAHIVGLAWTVDEAVAPLRSAIREGHIPPRLEVERR